MKKPRKNNLRSRFTTTAIKNALLDTLRTKEFSRITVAELCTHADIHRTTFYLHYSRIDDVLQEVIDDALAEIGEVFDQFPYCIEDTSTKTPLCQFIRNNKMYQPLFLDQTIADYFIGKAGSHYMHSYVERVSAQLGIPTDQAESIFWFQIHGCFALATHNIASPDDQWEKTKRTIDSFIFRGMSK